MAEHPKNQSEHSKPHDLVKPGSTMDPKAAPPAQQGYSGQPGQGQPGQNQTQGGQQGQPARQDDRRSDMERMRDTDPRFLEKTRPEDPSGRAGQLTRDNVNPNIPSSKPGDRTPNAGGIVDPRSLGMEQGGKAPNYSDQHASINEPPGSDVGSGEEGSTGEGGAGAETLKITSLEPDSAEIGGGNETFGLVVTGEGFDETCKIVFDDEEVETEFVNETTLRAMPPMNEEAGEVDVEVERGEESSEVLTFEFTAANASRSEKKREPARKPKKPTPSAKRDKSGKKKRK